MKMESMIKLRVTDKTKESFKKRALKKNMSVSRLVRDSVEKRLKDKEWADIEASIEYQDNILQKVGGEINQLAKNLNSKKYVTNNDMNIGLDLISMVIKLKEEQNVIFQKIYNKIENTQRKRP